MKIYIDGLEDFAGKDTEPTGGVLDAVALISAIAVIGVLCGLL